MADYIYLLENRLSAAQKSALATVRDVVRAKGQTLFLVGGAVRDLTSGSPVRDLDVVVQGNALKLRKDLELAGATVQGSADATQVLYLKFPGGVRMEVGSTLSASYPKPGKPVYKAATILEDLRRRDFTANAMALSLNDGSYGLLMDPLNGVADIENRELRLASNYGFIEDPIRMVRAARFSARLGWTLEEKTQGRYDTGKEEGYISALQDFPRGYEVEEIVHEEDPLRVIRRLESEGWMQVLAPEWGSAKANVVELEKVRDTQTQLQMQGIHPDAATVNFPLLTAKMSAKDVDALKKSFPRPGFVAEIDALEGEAKDFAMQLGGKAAATPSAAYRLILSSAPEAVLSVVYATKSAALQAKFKSFFGEWPQMRQKIPYALMQEMRITPELPGYVELVEKLFFELMDGNLGSTEEMKAFLEPYSPPAPPPPVHLRRARAARKDAKGKARAKKGAALAAATDLDDEDDDREDNDDAEDAGLDDEDEDDSGDDGDEPDVAALVGAAVTGLDEDEDADSVDGETERGGDDRDDDDDEDEKPARPVKAKAPAKKAAASAPVRGKGVTASPVPAAVKKPIAQVVAVSAKVAAKSAARTPVVATVKGAGGSKAVAAKSPAAPAKGAKQAVKPVAAKASAKTHAAVKVAAKAPVKVAAKSPAKKKGH